MRNCITITHTRWDLYGLDNLIFLDTLISLSHYSSHKNITSLHYIVADVIYKGQINIDTVFHLTYVYSSYLNHESVDGIPRLSCIYLQMMNEDGAIIKRTQESLRKKGGSDKMVGNMWVHSL